MYPWPKCLKCGTFPMLPYKKNWCCFDHDCHWLISPHKYVKYAKIVAEQGQLPSAVAKVSFYSQFYQSHAWYITRDFKCQEFSSHPVTAWDIKAWQKMYL